MHDRYQNYYENLYILKVESVNLFCVLHNLQVLCNIVNQGASLFSNQNIVLDNGDNNEMNIQ